MKSVMTHQFSQIPKVNIQRSVFDRSHGYKTTMDGGFLVPFFVDEALPGDTFNLQTTLFGRFSTPIVPIMDNVFLETFFFAVPYRLVWENFQKFMGEQENPGDSTDYLIPQMSSSRTVDGSESVYDCFKVGELADYMGIPPNVKKLSVNSLHFRAYNLIYNEWFRNENLQDSVPVIKNDGTPTESENYHLLKRAKRKDYFTSCLPWPQKGPGVELPIGNLAPVVTGEVQSADDVVSRFSKGLLWSNRSDGALMDSYNASGGQTLLGAGCTNNQGKTGLYRVNTQAINQMKSDVVPSNLYADLSEATAATINSVRQAFQVQRLLERDAVGGTRYRELILAHFSVLTPDARLQRPEYLGGGSSQIHFQPVPQTSATDGVTPQANMAAYGIVAGTNHGFVKSFTEHCLIVGLVNLRADLNYQQGLNRMWSRRTRFDFYWPTLAHLGEQAVLNKEIYAQGVSVVDTDGNIVDDKVFGYQERYAEYRYYPSLITGKFRSSDPQSLDVWHLAQDFGNLPQLNAEFIEDNPPFARILAVQDEPQLLLDCYFNMKCTRPMPLYGVPGLVDHF